MVWDIDAASEEWLKEHVNRMEIENRILAGLDEGNRVIKISDKMVVKCGFGVTAQEAATLEYAYRHADSTIFRVPQMHRFFLDKSRRLFPWETISKKRGKKPAQPKSTRHMVLSGSMIIFRRQRSIWQSTSFSDIISIDLPCIVSLLFSQVFKSSVEWKTVSAP